MKKVRAALQATALGDRAQELAETARSAGGAAKALGADKGAIAKSLIFVVGEQPVLELIAGDRLCKADALPRALNLGGGSAPMRRRRGARGQRVRHRRRSRPWRSRSSFRP